MALAILELLEADETERQIQDRYRHEHALSAEGRQEYP